METGHVAGSNVGTSVSAGEEKENNNNQEQARICRENYWFIRLS